MLQEIKKQLFEDKKSLIQLLREFGFCNFKESAKYITFGRDEDSSRKAIAIKKINNEALYVTDYARNIHGDIIHFIIAERGVSYSEVMGRIRSVVGDFDFYGSTRSLLFGGMFQRVKRKNEIQVPVLDESVLENYIPMGNELFLNDGISIDTQRVFGVGFSPTDQAITIPIYRPDGLLMGVKARINGTVRDGEMKYFYLTPCPMSQTLYGFHINYEFLESQEWIFIVEAEKSVMQAYEFKERRIVAICSSSISVQQARMIVGLNAKNVVLMHDEGIKKEAVYQNCMLLKRTAHMREMNLWVWNPGDDVPSKASPTDLGETRFIQAVEREIVKWKET